MNNLRHEACWRPTLGLLLIAVMSHAGAAQAAITVEAPVSYEIGDFPTDLIAADLTGDGRAELITANFISGDVSVLTNLGDGTFTGETRHDMGAGMPIDVAAGDLDGDGDQDLVVSIRLGDGVLAVLLNRGDGTLDPATQYGPSRAAFAPILADLDNDDDLDAAIVYGSATAAAPVCTA